MIRRSACCIFLVLFFTSPQIHAQQKKPAPRFTPEHLDRLVTVSDPQISPDGRQISLLAV